jgi:cholesterol oxidase
MVGCRFGAKNTLDQNYLYLAEKRDAQVFAETRVVDVKPLDGASDGSLGYEVHTEDSLAFFNKRLRRFTCRSVVFAASALGTTELLFRLKEKRSLPGISSQLGKHIRTNSESLIGVRIPGSKDNLSQGVAIGSGVYIDEHTHIEAVRYPSGSDVMGFLATILTGGRPGSGRVGLWMKNLLLSMLRHPIRTIRVVQPFGFARESIILLCMQALDSHIDLCWERPWFWPFRKFLVSRGDKVPTYIPKANEFAEKFASMAGGSAMSMVPEILFDVPGTAHCLGGCIIAESPDKGVVDSHHRVFGYQNMYVCDGSVIAANLGVNPSLTITALAERAIGFIPPAASADWNDGAERAESCV